MRKKNQMLEKLTGKWWFYIIMLFAQFLILPYSSKNFNYTQIGNIISTTLNKALLGELQDYFIYIQVTSTVLFMLLFIMRNKVKKIFNVYVFISYLLFTVLQNIAFTEKYGLSIVSINIVMFLLVAFVWLRELINSENDYNFINLNWKTSWLIILSLICFWWPMNWETLNIDFQIKHFLFNGSSLAFCAMTPIFLTIMTLNLPRVNVVTYRITAIIGTIIGLYNMMNFTNTHTSHIAILHLPLIIISTYSLIMSYKIRKQQPITTKTHKA